MDHCLQSGGADKVLECSSENRFARRYCTIGMGTEHANARRLNRHLLTPMLFTNSDFAEVAR